MAIQRQNSAYCPTQIKKPRLPWFFCGFWKIRFRADCIVKLGNFYVAKGTVLQKAEEIAAECEKQEKYRLRTWNWYGKLYFVSLGSYVCF